MTHINKKLFLALLLTFIPKLNASEKQLSDMENQPSDMENQETIHEIRHLELPPTTSMMKLANEEAAKDNKNCCKQACSRIYNFLTCCCP